MEFSKIRVTPKIAKQYLEANTRNRNIKPAVLARYVNDIKKGRWKQDTGEFVKISKTGNILDGQHRLTAIILSNTAITLDFIFGLDDSVFDVIDTGASRTASDAFKIDGIKNSKIIPSIISFNHLLSIKKIGKSKRNKLTNAQVLEVYNKDPYFWQETAKKTIAWYNDFTRIVPPSWIGGFYVFLSSIDEKKGNEFITQLCTGNDVSNKMINKLRGKLIKDKLATKKTKKRIRIALFIKCWNLFITNKELKLLSFDSEREKFPEAIHPQ